MALVLSPQELIELTGREKPTYQRKQLDHLKIPFKTRTDGTLVVHHSHVDLMLGAKPDRDSKPEPRLRFG